MSDRYAIDGTKIHLHPERVAQWIEAGDDWEKQKKIYPIYAEISPVGACNHRCTFCAVDYIGYKNTVLGLPHLSSTISNMAERGVKSIMFAGEGEPLLYRSIDYVVNHAKRLGIDVAITTNATLLDESKVRECLGSVSWLKASINAGSPETYAAIHQTKEDDFSRVFNNLARAVVIRNQEKWKTSLGAQCVLLPENMAEIFDLADRCKDIGLDYLVVKPYSQHKMSPETAKRYGDLSYADHYKLKDALARMETKDFKIVFRMNTMKHLEEPVRYYEKCYSTPFMWAYIMATGDVYGCSAYLLDERFRYGNIHEETFSQIWEGERRRASAEFVRKELDIHECRKNCRMENVNRYLWDVIHPVEHANFI